MAVDWLKYAAIPGAVLALLGIWAALGFQTPALSGDIQRLDRQNVDTAIDIYRKNVRDATILRGAVKGDPTAERFVDEDAAEARENLKRAQQRKIELSK